VSNGEPAAHVADDELEFDEEFIYRHNGTRFTGIGFERGPNGILSEVSYRDGLQDGPALDYYPSGVLRGVSDYRQNSLHGRVREFGEDGTLLQESVYEYGILLHTVMRDQSGELAETFRIDENGPNYVLLRKYRRERDWPRFG
jgi:hypothetical protein